LLGQPRAKRAGLREVQQTSKQRDKERELLIDLKKKAVVGTKQKNISR
jgi:hypothetical protein